MAHAGSRPELSGSSVRAGIVLVAGVSGLIATPVINPPQDADPLLFVAATGFVLIGALLLARVPANRVGWVVSGIGLALVGAAVAGALDDRGYLVGDALGGALWLSWFALAGFLFLWFPTGRPLSRSWRLWEWVGYLMLAVALSHVVAEDLCVDGGDVCRGWVPNPWGVAGVPNPEYGPYSGLTYLLLGVFVLGAIVSLAVRFRGSRGPERLQMKGFLFAAIGWALGVPLEEMVLSPLNAPYWLSNSVFGFLVSLVPLAIGLAVLRYRLFEIERIISRTVAYGLLIAVLATVYFGGITLLSQVLPVDSDLAVAASTLSVAGLFNPLRRRLQRLVDRRFNRSRYDAQRVIDAFSSSLRNRVDPIHMEEDLAGVVAQTLQPARVGIWVRR